MCSRARSIAGTVPEELKPYWPNETIRENSSVSTPMAASNAAKNRRVARYDIAATIHHVAIPDEK